jgi:uncharacterized protein YaaR (DUF327 family)
MLNVVL